MLHVCKHEVFCRKDTFIFLKSSVQKRDIKFTMLWAVIPCNWAVMGTFQRNILPYKLLSPVASPALKLEVAYSFKKNVLSAIE